MKFKRIAALAVGAVLMLGAAGCSGATTENESAEEQITSENTESVDNGDGTRTIIDQVGNEVVLPEKIERCRWRPHRCSCCFICFPNDSGMRSPAAPVSTRQDTGCLPA